MRHFLALALLLCAAIVRGDESPGDAPRALMTEWVRAQNVGDIRAYTKLYAEEFHAMRGAEGKFARVDSKAWFAEHARLFAEPRTVTVRLVDVMDFGTRATVGFWQTVSRRGTERSEYRLLWLVKQRGELRIAAEDVEPRHRADCGSTLDKSKPFVSAEKPSGTARVVHVVGETTLDGVRRSMPVDVDISCSGVTDTHFLESDTNGNISFWTNHIGGMFISARLETRPGRVRRGETAQPRRALFGLPKGRDDFFADHAHLLVTPDVADTVSLGALDSYSYTE